MVTGVLGSEVRERRSGKNLSLKKKFQCSTDDPEGGSTGSRCVVPLLSPFPRFPVQVDVVEVTSSGETSECVVKMNVS